MNLPRRVALVHYHLRPGGVTSVIRSAAGLLSDRGAACVTLSGTAPAAGWPGALRVCPALDYDASADGPALRAELTRLAAEALGGPPDVWYVHNHNLGRNRALLEAVSALAAADEALLLQPHDFAEDGRPARYAALRAMADGEAGRLAGWLYPDHPRVHFATLTRRDAVRLVAAGATSGRVHHLPNPVERAAGPPPPPPGRGLRLYPTRAIRRKNLGEFLLWAATGPAGARWATTLAPRSPADRAIYERWVAFAADRGLPVAFAVGARAPERPLADWLAEADEVFTTSVAEGFGLAYLEPWLAGRPLRGRDLPALTADFRAAGLALPGLYERLDVPLAWVGIDAVRAALEAGLRRARAVYGRATGPVEVEAAWRAAVCGDQVDFGRLDESLQARAIVRAQAEPGWAPPATPGAAPETVMANAGVVATAYGAEAAAGRLGAAMAATRAGQPGAAPDAARVLASFLDPAEFFLLRT